MGVTVVVNYMTVSHKGSSGISIAFPDICKTPILGVPVPIPYPNIAMSSDLKKGSKKVKCDGEKVVLKSSKIKRSMGDEVGVQKGLISNKQMGKAKFANYSFDVKVEGKNVCRLADPTTQNRGTINAAAFCHLQAPASVKDPNAKIIEGACEEVEKKIAEQQEPGPKSGSAESAGIIEEHWAAMESYLEENPLYLIYFRATGKRCADWIKANHAPKPHEVTDGTTYQDHKRELAESLVAWLKRPTSWRTDQFLRAMDLLYPNCLKHDAINHEGWSYGCRLATQNITVADVKPLLGVVIRTGDLAGRPEIGTGTEMGLPFDHMWMTADYDIMDVVFAESQCERPSQFIFGLLQDDLNKAMKWPGIQHPYQSVWNTVKDKNYKGEEEFSVTEEIDTWMGDVAKAKQRERKAGWRSYVKRAEETEATARNVPTGKIAPGRDHPLIDDKLTILGPEGGLYLENAEDYWDALACCGCLDLDKPEPRQDELEAQVPPEEARTKFKPLKRPDGVLKDQVKKGGGS